MPTEIASFFLQIEALPEIIEAVNGKMEVYMDGGIRKGTDVFKALALGAKAVFFGRPALWGLSYNVRILLLIYLRGTNFRELVFR